MQQPEAMGRASIPVLDPEFLEGVVLSLESPDSTAAAQVIEELVACWLYDPEFALPDETGP